ncbi:hypothetical protein [Streptobacillus canis]|uniref:hypothetical protein n=1 Tax=Streptobacillus canis TaxID=2678686 RepID=UPI0012E25339|nr:hypothetical protein [Streptobacillus canis]
MAYYLNRYFCITQIYLLILFSESKHNGYKIDTTLAYDQDFNFKPYTKGWTISIGFMPEWKQEINTTQDITFGVKTSATLGLAVKNFGKSVITEALFCEEEENEEKRKEYEIKEKKIIEEATAKASSYIEYYPHSSINLTGIVDFNYLINDKMKGYIGIEAGIGINFLSTQERTHILEVSASLSEDNEDSDDSGYVGRRETKIHTEVAFELGPIIKGSLGVKINDKYNIGIFGGYGNKGLAGIEMGYKF